MLTYNELTARVLYNVQDPNNDIYPSGEVDDKINEAKDEVLALVQEYTDLFPQSSTSIAFAAGEKEKDLPADFIEPLYIESTIEGIDSPRRHNIEDFRNKNLIRINDDLFLRKEADGQWVIGRVYGDTALTITVYYVGDVDDQTTDGVGFTFGPKPADNLIIVIATHRLLFSRRREGIGYWLDQEQKLTARLIGVLNRLYKTNADYVNTSEDTERHW